MLCLLTDANATSEQCLFQLPIATIELSPNMSSTDEILTKDGSRLFPTVTLRDHSGSIDVRMTEKMALKMSGQDSKDSFVSAFQEGDIKFLRGGIRILRQVQKPTGQDSQEQKHVYVNMMVVAGEPSFCFAIRSNAIFPLHTAGSNIMAASLKTLSLNGMNQFVIHSGSEQQFIANSVLLLLKSPNKTSACSTEARGGDFAIRHQEIICMAEPEPYASKVNTFTITSLAKVQDYQISRNKPCLCMVTSALVDDNDAITTLFIGEVWTTEQFGIDESQAVNLFRREMKACMNTDLKGTRKRGKQLSTEDYNILFTPSPQNPKVNLDFASQILAESSQPSQ
jgi:hypothetical protein